MKGFAIFFSLAKTQAYNFMPPHKTPFLFILFMTVIYDTSHRRKPDNNFSSLPRRPPPPNSHRKIFQFSIQPEDWIDDLERGARLALKLIIRFYFYVSAEISDKTKTPFLLLSLKQRLAVLWMFVAQPLTFFSPFSTWENMNYGDDNIDYSVVELEIFFTAKKISTTKSGRGVWEGKVYVKTFAIAFSSGSLPVFCVK